jgi:Zn-dependent protease
MEQVVYGIPILLFSVVVHEYAHGWTAYRAGDPTAMMAGRLTLNPIPHLDLVGSIIVPLIIILTPGTSFFIAWAKPVPVNPMNFRNGRSDDMKVALAGPLSNIALAAALIILGVLLGVVLSPSLFMESSVFSYLPRLIVFGIQINLILAVFNLIPVPPLDGSHILGNLLPEPQRTTYEQIGRYGFIILMLLIVTGIIHIILIPVWKISNALGSIVYFSIFT